MDDISLEEITGSDSITSVVFSTVLIFLLSDDSWSISRFFGISGFSSVTSPKNMYSNFKFTHKCLHYVQNCTYCINHIQYV